MKRLLDGLASGPGHLLPLRRRGPILAERAVRAGGRPVPHRARVAPRRPLRLVRRHRRAGLRHRRRGNADLCDDRAPCAGLLHPLRRRDLRRRSARGRGGARRRDRLEEPRDHRRQAQGGGDARRVPRPVEIQPARRARLGNARAGAGLPSMGRPRGHQQLVAVAVAAGGRPLPREVGAAARRPRPPRLPRDDAGADRADRAGPDLPPDRLRAAARRLLPRLPLLSRAELPGRRPGPGGSRATCSATASSPG